MIQLSVRNHKGELLKLTDSAFADVINIIGLNPTPANLILTELAGVDGARYNSGRRQQRNVVITLAYRPPIENNRNAIYKYFPTNTAVRLYLVSESRNVYIDGYVESNEVELFSQNEQSQISVICPDPYFRSAKKNDVNFSSTISLFQFPFSIPAEGVEFSKVVKVSTVVINAGDISTGAIFTLSARASQILNPVIYNNTTNEYFGLDIALDQGDTVIINTHRGNKSVILIRDGVATNILADRKSGSKWLQLAAGENEISYSCDEGAENLDVNIVTEACFEGV